MPTSPILTGDWQVDQHAIYQGQTAEEATQFAVLAKQDAHFWEAAATLGAQQPIMTHCDEAQCRRIEAEAATLAQQADTLVVIGTGGATLGAQALCAFSPNPSRVIFLENCDTQSIARIFNRCDLTRTAWLMISKSGETVETLASCLAVIARYETLGHSLAGRVRVITSPGSRPLRALAEKCAWPVIDHPPTLGGRFSVFSCVGLLPAAFAALDIEAIAQAARSSWHNALTTKDTTLFQAACWFATGTKNHPMHVVMGYSDRLRAYTQWYKQLWAESLGKNGQGPTPITAIGSIDQHSQLQLYLDGPRDKLFTLILPANEPMALPLATVDLPGVAYLGGHSMAAIMNASAEATVATLESKQLPLRVLRGPLSAETMAQLMARTMLETLLVAAMLGVDPYSQPAVEEGKMRARNSLGLHSA